jgi:hypothetical protein
MQHVPLSAVCSWNPMVVVNGTPDNTLSHLLSTIRSTIPWSREHQAGNVKGTVAYSTSRACGARRPVRQTGDCRMVSGGAGEGRKSSLKLCDTLWRMHGVFDNQHSDVIRWVVAGHAACQAMAASRAPQYWPGAQTGATGRRGIPARVPRHE